MAGSRGLLWTALLVCSSVGSATLLCTIVAGVALGTLITVAAVGAVPPRPAPNLCWHWSDPYGHRGYWDYCY